MDVAQKLEVLAGAAKYDASCASSGVRRSGAGGLGSTARAGVCHSFTPDGRCVSLLKILYTNHCIFDCHYCVNRRSSPIPRARFTADEVARLTIDFYKRNYVEGLFLSSGILRSPDYTMEQLTQVARQLRTQYAFRGYIHLKAIPHCSGELLAEAGRWADRLSVNIELPTRADLELLAPDKDGQQIEGSMHEVCTRVQTSLAERRESARAAVFAPAGQSTQMIIGATPSTDADILRTADRLYRSYRLRRVYYSAFSPVPDADQQLPVAAPPLVREHRLYQADWLLRYYDFAVDELVGDDLPQLDLELDPKHSWALRNRDRFPVDVNRADRELLLRVPGLGVRNVQRILRLRQQHAVRLSDLRRLRVAMKRAQPFLITADHNPVLAQLDRGDLAARTRPGERQLLLFETARSATSGEI
ncbi:MAG: putative DNA modification/repair radical SAM protein [Pirellulaceae bacterium]